MVKGPIAFVNYLSNPIVGGGKEIKFKRIFENLRTMGVDVRLFNMWETNLKYTLFHVFGSDYYLTEFVEVASIRAPVVVTTVFYSIRNAIIFRLLSSGRRFPIINDVVKSTTWELRRRLLEKARLLMPNCEAEAQQIAKYFRIPREKMRIVPSGVDVDFKNGNGERFFKRTGLKDFVLCVARVESRKNQLRLLNALKDTGLKVLLIGPPHPLEPDYARAVEQVVNGNENFHWMKGLEYSEDLLKDAYKAAKVHALPSIFDAPGQSSLQAGIAGINIVVSDIPPVREYVRDYAFYSDPFNEESIKNAVLKAWDSPPSHELQKHIETHYTWDKVAKMTLSVYEEALSIL